MTKELLYKYINNECTPEELDAVLKWFEKESDKIESRALLKQLWYDFGKNKSLLKETAPVDYERILDKVHHNLNISLMSKQDIPTRMREKHRKRILQFMTRAAAVLFIPVFLFALFLYQEGYHGSGLNGDKPVYSEVFSPKGSITVMDLPDGTKVWLNHGSHLGFPQRFTGKVRKVELRGEGYFQVAHNPKKPFIVQTEKLQVMALGTEFNVSAYPEDKAITTVLLKGKVQLRHVNAEGKIHPLLEMKPDQLSIFYKKQKKLICRTENTDKYISWKDGRLVFCNDPLNQIAKRLSRWYNVDIILKDPQLSQYTYTATFVDETLPQVLALMKLATPINYRIYPRVKQKDGSFSSLKVVITMKKDNT